MIPIIDFRSQPGFDLLHDFLNVMLAASADFFKMRRDYPLNGKSNKGALFEILVEPKFIKQRAHGRELLCGCRRVVEVGSVSCGNQLAGTRDFNKLKLAGNCQRISIGVFATVGNGVFQVEQDAGFGSRVVGVASTAPCRNVSRWRSSTGINRGVQQRMTGGDERRGRLVGNADVALVGR